MRVYIQPTCQSAAVLKGYIIKAGYIVVENRNDPRDYAIYLSEFASGRGVNITSVKGEFEDFVIQELERQGITSFSLNRGSDNKNDQEIMVEFATENRERIEKGLLNAFLKTVQPLTKVGTITTPKKSFWAALLGVLLLSANVEAQVSNPIIRLWDSMNGVPVGAGDITSRSLRITCISGCGGAAAFNDNTAFTFGTTSIGNIGFVVDDVDTNTVAENSAGTPRMSTNRIIYVDLSKSGANTTAFLVTGTGGTFPVTGTVAVSNSFLLDATFTGRINTQGQKAMSASTPVVLASDQSKIPINISQTTTDNDVDATVTSFPDNEPFNVAQIGGVAVVSDPCIREARIPISITQTAGTQLITGTASERIFICSFHIYTATAQNIALVSGTGSVCATSPSGVVGFGGSTVATGWNWAANQGIQMGHSNWSYGKTDTDADNVCLLQSGSGQVSGGLTYVSAPNF